MKQLNPLALLLFAVLCGLPMASTASLILVDYDDGFANGIHDASVRNGGFENPFTAVDGEPFSNTDFWTNIEGGSAEQARRTNINDTGSYSSVNNVSGTKRFALDTNYTIGGGDELYLEFRALRAFNSNNTSELTADLYFTSNGLIDGTQTVIGTISEDNLSTSFATYSDTFIVPLGGAAVGENLFLQFEQSAGPGFTRTDGWFLTVTPIPEPSTTLLLTTFLGGFSFLRRRRKLS